MNNFGNIFLFQSEIKRLPDNPIRTGAMITIGKDMQMMINVVVVNCIAWFMNIVTRLVVNENITVVMIGLKPDLWGAKYKISAEIRIRKIPR
jgi:hypothetical protein